MKFNRILVIQTAFLGDVILATPVLKALKITFPGAQVDVITIPETSIIFENNPNVSGQLIFDKKQSIKKIISFFRTVALLRKNRYDAAISIQSSITSTMLMVFGGIPVRVGFERQKFLTRKVTEKSDIHTRVRYLRLLEPFSQNIFNSQTEIFWSHQEEQKAQNLVESYKKNDYFLIGIAPGSVWHTKKWLKEYFVELLKLLTDKQVKIFMIGGKNETLLCSEIIEQSNNSATIVAGSFSAIESAALVSKLDLMITNDSAPLHIANAVKTDVIAFFGPTMPNHGFYPYRENDKIMEIDLYCRPCSKHGGKKCPEKHFRCMRDITPQMVYDEIIEHKNEILREKR